MRVRLLFACALLVAACGTVELDPIFRHNSTDSGVVDSGSDADAASDAPADANRCPPQRPGPNQRCEELESARCDYGNDQCRCGGDSWRCTPCPGAAPPNGAPCGQSFGQCEYGGTECNCFGGSWRCGACPDEAPGQGEGCTAYGILCSYDATQCGCFGTWGCVASGSCPPQRPADGDPCTEPFGSPCPYGPGFCACVAFSWRCP